MLIGEYKPEHFHGLPTLETAREKFKALNGDALVKDVFRPFFLQHGMDERFGLAILHRHFDLTIEERLVDYNGTSSPWPTAPTKGIEEPHPSIWAKAPDGYFRPTEYRYSRDDGGEIGEAELSFMDKFDQLLQRHDASGVFGLCCYPGNDFEGSCEITVGRANINLKPADYPNDLQQVDTAWFFSVPLWTRGCRCTCNASAADHPHGTHVYTISG
ncbi:hypothetical protein AJ79_09791 [Helicocarpus griseus UAMH5409]|uniref:Uncharacterized protein n=1 Tax=Helicocarpus griseus UAMH5409 TaxID=1447875 RepID=A0A2B7WHI1_9EURO|nr:hypothetical protein AJ79_09791 [Helicocarpus griseus UAMH5409]